MRTTRKCDVSGALVAAKWIWRKGWGREPISFLLHSVGACGIRNALLGQIDIKLSEGSGGRREEAQYNARVVEGEGSEACGSGGVEWLFHHCGNERRSRRRRRRPSDRGGGERKEEARERKKDDEESHSTSFSIPDPASHLSLSLSASTLRLYSSHGKSYTFASSPDGANLSCLPSPFSSSRGSDGGAKKHRNISTRVERERTQKFFRDLASCPSVYVPSPP